MSLLRFRIFHCLAGQSKGLPNYNHVVHRLKTAHSVSQKTQCLTWNFSSRNPVYKYHRQLLGVHHQGCHYGVRSFRTSPKHCVPPFVWMFAKPFMKLAAIVTGRGTRKWWQNLPKDKKSHFKEVLDNSWHKILTASGIFAGLCGFYYLSHLQETPITKRKRFIAFTKDQFHRIVEFENQELIKSYKGKILPTSHPSYKRIENVARKIIDSNQDLDFMRTTTWTVTVIDNEDINAFVLPNGQMFVMKGTLEKVKNDDQLAIVLGHEMSHAILGHGAEMVSFAQLLDMVVIVVMAAIWALMPNDGVALVTQWFYNKVVQILFNMPYSRHLETEADDVGLQLTAKACYDVRESSAFWSTMGAHSLISENELEIGWLSTHPTHEQRADFLDQVIPKAIDLRQSCRCHKLTGPDPRIEVKEFLRTIKDQLRTNRKIEVELPAREDILVPHRGQAE